MKLDLRETELENGLRVVQAYVPANEVTILGQVNAGALYEPENLSGISHFCEHAILKGTKRMPSNEGIMMASERMGGRGMAFTSKEETVFSHRVVLDDFHKGLEWVSDLLYEGRFDDKDIEVEKSVVLNEIGQEKDNPKSRLRCTEFDKVMFPGTGLGRPILGTEDTLAAITPEQARAFYNEYFNPSNTTLLIAGPHDFSELVEAVEQHFGAFPRGVRKQQPVITSQNAPRVKNIEQKLDSVYMLLGRLLPESRADEACAVGILGSVFNRRLFDRITDKEGGCYSCLAAYDFESSLYGRLLVSAAFVPQIYDKVMELIHEELEKARNGEFSDELIENQITYARKSFIFSNDTTESVARNLLKFHKTGDVYEINNRISDLDKLTPDKVRESAGRYIATDDLTAVSIGNIE